MTPNVPPAPTGRGLSTVLIVVLCFLGLCVVGAGVVAAIAVPNFIRFGVRAKQAEVRANLKAAFAGERNLEAEKDEYSEVVEEIGFEPEANNLYLYAFSARATLVAAGRHDPDDPARHTGIAADARRAPGMSLEVLQRAAPPALWESIGLHGNCPKRCVLTVVAGANLDADDTIDVWSVSTKDRVIDDVTVPAGTPFNHVDDVVK